MQLPGADSVLIRHGELGTKSAQVQAKMERQLADNLRQVLSREGIAATVRIEHGRIFVSTPSPQAVAHIAGETFGVSSASPVRTASPTKESITAALTAIAPDVYTSGSFAVRARRAGPKNAHPFTSNDLEEEIGSAIWQAVESDFDPEVDLDTPDTTFFIECRETNAYVFLSSYAGPGGFPYGTQGTVVPLISGGTDSPVAVWEMMRRGCDVVPVYFDFESFGGVDHVARVIATTRRLASYTPSGELELVRLPIGEKVQTLIDTTHDTRMLSLRRLMFALAGQIADSTDAIGLATGEAIGQKSSQTGPNLAATATATRYPIHRPLVNEDKESIISKAKDIGTYTESRIDAGCNRIAPSFPQTAGTVDEVVDAEPTELLSDLQSIIDRGETITVSAPTGTEMSGTRVDNPGSIQS